MFNIKEKLLEYFKKFKNIDSKTWVEIVFLAMFFVILFIPMLHIEKEDISKKENRTLASWKPLITKDFGINYNFSKDFENWFNDRFNFRYLCIDLYNRIYFTFNSINNEGAIDCKNGFLYLFWEFMHIDSRDLVKYMQYFYDLQNWCSENEIKLYVLVTPQKSDIYPSEKNYFLNKITHIENLELFDKIYKEKKFNLIYPYKALKNNSTENILFFKTDHHWTDDGAFIAYKELMKEISKDFSGIKTLNENDFNIFYNKLVRCDFDRGFTIGKTCNILHLDNYHCQKFSQTNYRYFRHKDFDNLNIEVNDTKNYRNKSYYYPYGNDLRAILIGSSHGENLSEFVPFTFKYTKRIRSTNIEKIPEQEEFKILKYYEREILDFKPDILIFNISYEELDDVIQLR